MRHEKPVIVAHPVLPVIGWLDLVFHTGGAIALSLVLTLFLAVAVFAVPDFPCLAIPVGLLFLAVIVLSLLSIWESWTYRAAAPDPDGTGLRVRSCLRFGVCLRTRTLPIRVDHRLMIRRAGTSKMPRFAIVLTDTTGHTTVAGLYHSRDRAIEDTSRLAEALAIPICDARPAPMA